MKPADRTRLLLSMTALVAVCITLLLQGCGPEPRDPAIVRAELIQAILKGVDRRGTHLSAQGYDAQSHELLNVHVQTKGALLYAQRGVIHVDEDGRYMSIKLFEVLNVKPIDEDDEPTPGDQPAGNDGRIQTVREYTISNIPTSM